jgi:hypothetical protein
MALRQNSFNRPRSLSDDMGDDAEIFRYASAPKLPTRARAHTGNARGRIRMIPSAPTRRLYDARGLATDSAQGRR